MESKPSGNHPEPTLGRTLRDDLRQGDFWATLRNDWTELMEYSLDDQRRARLSAMGAVKRWLVSAWWVLRQMMLKLTPARRILVVIGIVFLFVTTTVSDNSQIQTQPIFGGLLLLFVLLLELKDRLLAHDELQAGKTVQRALLPDDSPAIPGWSLWISTRSANEVGGDLVDHIVLGPGREGLVIADVSGKGLSAALLMAKLQTIIKTLAAEYSSLPQFAGRVNDAFRREGIANIFASMVYIELVPGAGVLRYVNAGHPPPFLLLQGSLKVTDKGEAAIGLMAQASYTERTTELAPGDLLVCYSDGLTEARNAAGEFYGTERLAALLPTLSALSAPEIGRALVAAVDRFAGQAHQHDDLSLVIMKRL